MKLYDYSPSSMCVANCLIAEEKNIQQKYESCADRNAERLRAHVRCYWSCGFFPHKGLPEGGVEVGGGMLLPDYVRDIVSD